MTPGRGPGPERPSERGNDAFAALAAVLMEEEDERRAFGELIHDRPLQALAVASIQLDAILLNDARLQDVQATESLVAELRAVQERIRAAGADLRDLLPHLVPLVEIGSLERVLARQLDGMQPPASVDLQKVDGLALGAGVALVRVAADVVATARQSDWPTPIRVEAGSGRVELKCGEAPHSSPLELGPLVTRVAARLHRWGGAADASEGPEGPSLAAWIPLD